MTIREEYAQRKRTQMERIMAVLSEEKLYAERLCNYANRNRGMAFTAVPFGTTEEYEAFEQKHPVKVLLCDEHLLEKGSVRGDLISIRLTRERSRAKRGGEAGIYKFQPAEAILREVTECCMKDGIRMQNRVAGKDVEIIGIYTPLADSRQTAFALTLCKMLSRKKKVLYLNLDEFSGFTELMEESYQQSLSDAFYHLKEGSLSGERIGSMIYRYEQIDYIPPLKFADDFEMADEGACTELVETILRESPYEILVLDLPVYAGRAAALLDLCSEVYVPVRNDFMSEMRVREFEQYIDFSGRLALLDKLRRIEIPDPGPIRNRGAYVETLLYGPIGDLVRELPACRNM